MYINDDDDDDYATDDRMEDKRETMNYLHFTVLSFFELVWL